MAPNNEHDEDQMDCLNQISTSVKSCLVFFVNGNYICIQWDQITEKLLLLIWSPLVRRPLLTTLYGLYYSHHLITEQPVTENIRLSDYNLSINKW